MEDIRRFDELSRRMERVYDQYARSIGLTNTGMYLLYLVWDRGSATQRELAEFMMLPKQTVHSIVKEYQKQGFLELAVSQTDRRQRQLRLTEAGMAFAQRHFPVIVQAETQAMAQFTPEERSRLLRLLERYANALEMKGTEA